jgi:hypothetical protein
MDFLPQFPNGDQISKSEEIAYSGMSKFPNSENRQEIG